MYLNNTNMAKPTGKTSTNYDLSLFISNPRDVTFAMMEF